MTTLVPAQPGGVADLGAFAQRVAKFEPEAVVRLVSSGSVAGCFAETPFDVLALRAVSVAEPLDVDVVLEAATLAARAAGVRGAVELPPALPALRWTSSLPPRAGFTELTRLSLEQVRRRVDRSVEEFRHRAPGATEGLALREGRSALEGLAAELWDDELAEGVSLRLAHAASSYGFLDGSGEVVLRSNGPWRRLDAPNGTIVARAGLALFAM